MKRAKNLKSHVLVRGFSRPKYIENKNIAQGYLSCLCKSSCGCSCSAGGIGRTENPIESFQR